MTGAEPRIVSIRITDLKPYEKNSRTHSESQIKQIAASISEFGFTNPVLVDGENGIVAGHGRVQAAKLIGMDVVPCLVLENLTAAKKRAYVIADNKIALNAGWNDETLAAELKKLIEDDYDLSLIGFSQKELDDLLFDATAGLTDEDETPELSDAPVSRLGDLWLLGPYFECESCKKVYDYEIGKNMMECPCAV